MGEQEDVPSTPQEQETGHAEHLAQILRDQVASMATGEALVPTLARLVKGACELAQVDPVFGILRLVDPETLILRRDVGSDGTMPVFADETTTPTSEQGITGWVVRKKRRIIIPDVRQEITLPDELDAPRYIEVNPATRSELAVPVLSGNRCLGVLNLESPHIGHFQETLYPWIETLAAQVALTMQHAALQEELQWLQRIGVTAAQSRIKLKALADDALEHLTGLKASIEILVRSQQEGGLVTLAFATNHQDGVLPGYDAPSASLVGQAFERGVNVKRPKIEEHSPATRVHGTRSVLMLPLRDQEGQVIGIFNVESPIEGALNDLETKVQEFAADAERNLREGNGADRVLTLDAELHDTERKVMSRLKDGGLPAVIQIILRQAVHEGQRQDLDNEQEIGAALVGIEGDRFVLKPGYTYHYPDVGLPNSWAIEDDQSVLGHALREGKLLLASNEAGSLYRPHVAEFAYELAVPVQQTEEQDERTLGILILASQHPGVLTEKVQKPLIRLAKISARALEEAARVRTEEQIEWINEWFEDIRKLLMRPGAHEKLSEYTHRIREALKELLQKHLKRAMARTNASYGAITSLITYHGGPQHEWREINEMVQRANEPPLPNRLIHFPYNQGISGKAIVTGEIQNIGDVRAPGVNFFELPGEDVQSELAIPMFRGEKEAFAVFDVERKTPGKFSDEEVAWARLYAILAGYAILSIETDLERRQMEGLRRFEQEAMQELLDEDPQDEELLGKVVALALDLTGQPDGYASFWRVEGGILRRTAYYTDDNNKLTDLESSTGSTLLSRRSPAGAKAGRPFGWPGTGTWRWLLYRISFQGRKARGESAIPRAPAHEDQTNGGRPEDGLPSGIIGEADYRQLPVLALDVTEDQWKSVFRPRWTDTKAELAVPVFDVFDKDKSKGTPAYVLGVLNVESPRLGDFETKDIQVLQSLAQTASAALSARMLYRSRLAPLRDDGSL